MFCSTYHSLLELLEHLRVALDFLITGVDGRHVNRNVSVGLRQRIVDLVRELEDVVLDFALGHERGQEDILDDRLKVAEPVLALFVRFRLNHLCLFQVECVFPSSFRLNPIKRLEIQILIIICRWAGGQNKRFAGLNLALIKCIGFELRNGNPQK